jgi:hypothetical protein
VMLLPAKALSASGNQSSCPLLLQCPHNHRQRAYSETDASKPSLIPPAYNHPQCPSRGL